MALANFGDLVRGMAVASADLAQILARHAVKTIDGVAMFASSNQQFVKGAPFVSPIDVEADALTKFVFIDFTAPPLFEHILMPGENGLDSEYDRAVSRVRALFEQGSGETLGRRQRMVVADQNNVGGSHGFGELPG